MHTGCHQIITEYSDVPKYRTTHPRTHIRAPSRELLLCGEGVGWGVRGVGGHECKMPELNNSVSVGSFNRKVGGWGNAGNHMKACQQKTSLSKRAVLTGWSKTTTLWSKKKKKMDVNYLATALKLRDRENSMITWSKHNEHLSFFLLISVLTSYKLVCFQQMHQVQSFWQMCKWHEYAVGNAWCNFPSPCRFLMEGKSQWFDSHGLIRIACSCSLISWCCWGNELIFYYW